ncbi:hypothetical protein HPC49_19940 [Pyxidicoccus fallax]|uniref:Lipoprotein n=1 Tax=Pyxidicoccus fallax TaxID=394095 RepID=A0A848LDU2_9BACT|nr:hypothetical protein [Pyxidicoccus fallax]NMO17199.1 hypothetical protein [Pyxidicoccus fallax]NPC80483.1 hypothetical protein [Pyxidicoccus fallax]
MRSPVVAALLALVACSRSTEGPTPRVQGVVNPLIRNATPARICNAQGGERGWRLEVAGERFAPMPGDVLSEPEQAAMPEVTLRGPTTLTLPRDRVFYVRPELLLVDVPTRDTTPPVELPEGSYSVEVSNPLGGSDSLADALVVLGPPSISRVVPPPNGYTYNAASPIVIEGTGFAPNTFPVVTLRREDGATQSLFVLEVTSPTRISTEIPPGTPEGRYDMLLTSPEGCTASLARALDITYTRLGTLTVEPRSGGELSNQVITLRNAPTGNQVGFSGAPDVYLLAPVKTDPSQVQRVPLRDVTFVSANEVTAVVPTCSGFTEPDGADPRCPNGIVPGGPYALEVADPNGAVGEVPASAGFTVIAGATSGLEPSLPHGASEP